MPDLPESRDPDIEQTLGLDRGDSRRRWLFVTLTVLVPLLAAGAAVAWWLHPAPGPDYQTVAVRRADLTARVTATGTLAPVNEVQVGAEISGRIAAVDADYNDHVHKGQVLARLDTEQLEAQVRQAQASLASARAALTEARASAREAELAWRRTRKLLRTRATSQQNLEAARAQRERTVAAVDVAQAQVTVARAALEAARTTLSKAEIRAPIDGVVISRDVEPGQTVAASFQTPVLFVLAQDLSKMELHVDIDEADVGAVKAGQHAVFTVDAYPGRSFPAELVSIHNAARTVQGVVSYEGVLTVDNSAMLLRPGMTATAEITTATRHDALLVPNSALRYTPPGHGAGPGESGERVWILRDARPEPVKLRTGLSDGRDTVVLEGDLRPGERVIVDTRRERPSS
ncbi:MAG TPA: efflux RND transporter periplasmic adaptor subunit [Gammaproteobacteria bacterium]|nr:efflux RND transporter periplasmic adaptor subunit [Gammaproteobacteria bacterium]